jgi:hypothetical protein
VVVALLTSCGEEKKSRRRRALYIDLAADFSDTEVE